MVDSKGIIVLVNEQTEALFEFNRSELLGKPINILVPDNIQEMHPAFIQFYINKPTPRAMGAGRKLYGQKKSGVQFPVEIGLRTIYVEEETYDISSVIDLTEMEATQNKLIQKNEELQQFSYLTSHDLKRPIINILNLNDFAQQDLEENNIEGVSDSLRKMKNVAQSMVQLLDDIFSLTKVDFINEKKTNFDIKRYLDRYEDDNALDIQTNQVTLKRKFNHTKEIHVQKSRLEQVLSNLLSNAIKYMDPDKAQRYIQVNTFNDDKHLYIQVQDNGLGIAAEHYQQVFDMFSRLENPGVEGSGLGLYLVKSHLIRMGSKISLDSVAGQGTTFTVKIPL